MSCLLKIHIVYIVHSVCVISLLETMTVLCFNITTVSLSDSYLATQLAVRMRKILSREHLTLIKAQ